MSSFVEIGPVVLEKNILKFRQLYLAISYMCNYLPLEKVITLYFNKIKSHSSKDALCQVWHGGAHERRTIGNPKSSLQLSAQGSL